MPDLILSQYLANTNIINNHTSNSLYIILKYQSTKVDMDSVAVGTVHMTIHCIHFRTVNGILQTPRLQMKNWGVIHKGAVQYIHIFTQVALITLITQH